MAVPPRSSRKQMMATVGPMPKEVLGEHNPGTRAPRSLQTQLPASKVALARYSRLHRCIIVLT